MKKTKIILSLAGLATVSTVLGPVLTSCGESTNVLIKFDTNGGTSIKSQRVKKGECVVKPDNPTKEGYDFGAWYTDKELTTEFDFTKPVDKSMTLYASWTNGTVTPTEWADAFNKVSNTSFANKNFTLDVTLVVEEVSNTYNILCADKVYKQTLSDSSTSKTTNLWEEFIDKIVLTTTVVGESKTTTFNTTSVITSWLTTWFAPYTNMYNAATYHQDTRSYSITDMTYGNITIKFDDKQRLSGLVYSYSVSGVRHSFSASFSNYGKTEISDIPTSNKIALSSDNFIAGDKQTASTNFSVTGEHLFIVTLPLSKLLNIDTTKYTYAKFGDANVKYKITSTPYILADSKQLTVGEDFTYDYSLLTIKPSKLTDVTTLTMVFLAYTELTEVFTNFKIYQNN